MNCSSCQQKIIGKIYPNNLCQSCYTYYQKGGKDNPLPPIGKIAYDERGFVICHICGKAYKKLGSHTKEKHKILIKDYKKKFQLYANARTTEKNYSNLMKNLAYKNNMPKQLKEVGIKTRFKKKGSEEK